MSEQSSSDPIAAAQLEVFVDETMEIARHGRRRAGKLDVVGGALFIVALVASILAVSAALGTAELSSRERLILLAAGAGAVVLPLVGSAMFYGFAALVRNSSRSLELQAIDSSLLD